jgi:hypothetical protein
MYSIRRNVVFDNWDEKQATTVVANFGENL